jgi:hypothetical protein
MRTEENVPNDYVTSLRAKENEPLSNKRLDCVSLGELV